MAEWSIAAVLKTVEAHTSGGSNPSFSANYLIACMDDNSNAKLVQAIFGFLEAVNSKRDARAVSELIRGMIEEMLAEDLKAREAGIQAIPPLWNRLDHAIRTPMNGILGFTEILLEEITDPDLRWKTEQILTSARRLMQMLENSSIYSFAMPLVDEIPNTSPPAVISSQPIPLPEAPGKRKSKSARKKLPNVLIVEDNMVNSNLLMQHIKKYCHLFFSQTGKAAIEVTRREKIDVIFMDINLGQGMDGTQAMHEIRKQSGNETLPVVAVTGFAGREDRDNFLKAGFNDFIAKPFERKDIISVMESLFKLDD